MGRARRVAVVGFVVAIPLGVVFAAACSGSDTTDLNASSGGNCPPCEGPPAPGCVGRGPCGCGPYDCPSDGGNTNSESSTANDGSPANKKPKQGTYMGICNTLDDGGGFVCD